MNTARSADIGGLLSANVTLPCRVQWQSTLNEFALGLTGRDELCAGLAALLKVLLQQTGDADWLTPARARLTIACNAPVGVFL
jgi:hypothetical protein